MATLDQIKKMGPLARIAALNDYIDKGTAAVTEARSMRIQAAAQLRADKEPAHWRRLAELTGLSEQHLRSAVASLPAKAKKASKR